MSRFLFAALLIAGFWGCASGPEVAVVKTSEQALTDANGVATIEGWGKAAPASAGLLYVLGTSGSGTDVQTEVRAGYRPLGSIWSENYVVGILEPGEYTLFSRGKEPFEGVVAALPVVVEAGKAGFVLQHYDPARGTLGLEKADEKSGPEHLKKRYLSMENTVPDFLGSFTESRNVEETWETLFRTEALEAEKNAVSGDVEAALSWVVSVVAYGRDMGAFVNGVFRQTLLDLSSACADETWNISSEPFTEKVRGRLDAVEAYFSKAASEEGRGPEGELAVELLRTVLSARQVHLEQVEISRLVGRKGKVTGSLLYDSADQRDRNLLTFLSSLEKTVRIASTPGIPSGIRLRVLECIEKLNSSTLKGCLKNAHVHRGIQKLGESDPDPLVRSHARRLSESILGYR